MIYAAYNYLIYYIYICVYMCVCVFKNHFKIQQAYINISTSVPQLNSPLTRHRLLTPGTLRLIQSDLPINGSKRTEIHKVLYIKCCHCDTYSLWGCSCERKTHCLSPLSLSFCSATLTDTSAHTPLHAHSHKRLEVASLRCCLSDVSDEMINEARPRTHSCWTWEALAITGESV